LDGKPSKEYGEVAFEMGEADLLDVFLMSQAAFVFSPEFQKRLEEMVDTDTVNVEVLVGLLHKSGFTEKILTNLNVSSTKIIRRVSID